MLHQAILRRRRRAGGISFSPANLFSSGEDGVYAIIRPSVCWQDTGGTTPSGVGDPVARVDDESGNGYTLLQATSANQPTLQIDGSNYYLSHDGGDYLRVTFSTTFTNVSACVSARLSAGNEFVYDDVDTTNSFSLYSPTDGDMRAAVGAASSNYIIGSGGWAAGSDFVSIATANGSTKLLTIEGTGNSGSKTTFDTLTGFNGFTLGAAASGVLGNKARTYGFLVIDRVLTTEERAQAQDFFDLAT